MHDNTTSSNTSRRVPKIACGTLRSACQLPKIQIAVAATDSAAASELQNMDYGGTPRHIFPNYIACSRHKTRHTQTLGTAMTAEQGGQAELLLTLNP